MTRREISNTRDLTFSGWIRKNLPDSATGFLVSDLDFILFNYKTKKIMLLEIKTRGIYPKTWQGKLFNNLDKWIKNGIDKDWQYLGFYLLRFENTFFMDGKCFLRDKEISEEELITFLSF